MNYCATYPDVESKNPTTSNAGKLNKTYFAFTSNTKGEHTNEANFKIKSQMMKINTVCKEQIWQQILKISVCIKPLK